MIRHRHAQVETLAAAKGCYIYNMLYGLKLPCLSTHRAVSQSPDLTQSTDFPAHIPGRKRNYCCGQCASHHLTCSSSCSQYIETNSQLSADPGGSSCVPVPYYTLTIRGFSLCVVFTLDNMSDNVHLKQSAY